MTAPKKRSYLERYRAEREDPFFTTRAIEQIISCLAELTTATKWSEVRNALVSKEAAEEVVCYCLGDLSELGVAFQLAFLLLISNNYGIPPEKRLVYDPLHDAKDRHILKLCGCTPLSRNEQAMRRVNCRTLFYMPFAPFNLTDNVVRANWDVLERVMLVGNPLQWVVDHRWRKTEQGKEVEDGSDRSEVKFERSEGYTSRAPCVEAALAQGVVTELTLWHNNLNTWTIAGALSEVEQAKQLDGGNRDDGDNNDSDEEEHDILTEAAHRARARHTLDATLATFSPPLAGWPERAPPPATRSRL